MGDPLKPKIPLSPEEQEVFDQAVQAAKEMYSQRPIEPEPEDPN
jgi:hypothetical protein